MLCIYLGPYPCLWDPRVRPKILKVPIGLLNPPLTSSLAEHSDCLQIRCGSVELLWKT